LWPQYLRAAPRKTRSSFAAFAAQCVETGIAIGVQEIGRSAAKTGNERIWSSI
jgi:hypothetical protein